MCYPRNIESLPTFGIKTLRTQLQREGYSLGKIDSLLSSGGFVQISQNWTQTDSWGERKVLLSVEIYLRKDENGLYLETHRGDLRLGERYYLEKRESNLKPGTFRYYFADPFTPGTLCEKLYYLPDVGEFLPRSILSSHRVRYSQQRKGHSDRYFFSPKHIPEGKELRYRKSHYRGKITPFWDRYQRLSEERDWKITEYTIGRGFASGIIDPEIEREVKEEYRKHSGRKNLPSRNELYPR